MRRVFVGGVLCCAAAVIAFSAGTPRGARADTLYQCDDYVITENPEEYSGCTEFTEVQAGVSRFGSVREMFEGFKDFSTSDGTLRIEEEGALTVILMPSVSRHQTGSNVQLVADQALLYGVYRSFAHTPVDQIEVEVLPIQYERHGRAMERYRGSISINRQSALSAIQEYAAVGSMGDLVTAEQSGGETYSDQWGPEFSEIYYDGGNARRFVRHLHRSAAQ